MIFPFFANGKKQRARAGVGLPSHHPDISPNRFSPSLVCLHWKPLEVIIAKSTADIKATSGMHSVIMCWKWKLVVLTGMKMSLQW